MMSNATELGLLRAIEENPGDVASRLAYADWLEEQGRPYEAMQQRVKAGVSEARFKVRRKSDGLFSEGGEKGIQWSARGKEWKQLGHVRAHLVQGRYKALYGDNTAWDNLEITVFEVRVQLVTALPLAITEDAWKSKLIRIQEPGPT